MAQGQALLFLPVSEGLERCLSSSPSRTGGKSQVMFGSDMAGVVSGFSWSGLNCVSALGRGGGGKGETGEWVTRGGGGGGVWTIGSRRGTFTHKHIFLGRVEKLCIPHFQMRQRNLLTSGTTHALLNTPQSAAILEQKTSSYITG